MGGKRHVPAALPPGKRSGTHWMGEWGGPEGRLEGWGKPRPPARYNLLKPNDIYICRTAALTSRRYILNIYSTNLHTEYFKHAA